MLTKTIDTPTEERWESPTGELTIRRPSPLVVLFVEKGHLEAAFAPLITEAMNKSIGAGGKPHLFVDAEHLSGYDPSIRVEATKWIGEHRSEIVVQHMLVKSRITKMGLSVASMMLGGIIVGHHARSGFESALREAILQTRTASRQDKAPSVAPPPSGT